MTNRVLRTLGLAAFATLAFASLQSASAATFIEQCVASSSGDDKACKCMEDKSSADEKKTLAAYFEATIDVLKGKTPSNSSADALAKGTPVLGKVMPACM